MCAPKKNTHRWEPLTVLGRLELSFLFLRLGGMVVFSMFLKLVFDPLPSLCFSSTLIHPSSCWLSRSTRSTGICYNENARCFQCCAYVQRQKQTKEKRTLRITEKKIHGFKNKSNWGGLRFQEFPIPIPPFFKHNFQTFFRLFHLKKRQWISMYHLSSFRNRCTFFRLCQ